MSLETKSLSEFVYALFYCLHVKKVMFTLL